VYDSKAEAYYAMHLDTLKRRKQILTWDPQVRLPILINDKHVCDYIIDFVVIHNTGVREFVEVKGRETDVWKLKWKMFKVMYEDSPNTKLTIVKV
jgi:hypothetical protein